MDSFFVDMTDHDVCALPDPRPQDLSDWARAIAVAADQATDAELHHALDHLEAPTPTHDDERYRLSLVDELALRYLILRDLALGEALARPCERSAEAAPTLLAIPPCTHRLEALLRDLR